MAVQNVQPAEPKRKHYNCVIFVFKLLSLWVQRTCFRLWQNRISLYLHAWATFVLLKISRLAFLRARIIFRPSRSSRWDFLVTRSSNSGIPPGVFLLFAHVQFERKRAQNSGASAAPKFALTSKWRSRKGLAAVILAMASAAYRALTLLCVSLLPLCAAAAVR